MSYVRVDLIALLVLSAGCSLVGLDDQNLRSCVDNTDCEVLNRDLEEGSCQVYLCDAMNGVCLLGNRDDDEDGAASIDCGGDDCDDENAERSPLLEEVCGNLVDEDCSGAANDLDCDGEDSIEQGGTDCDDNDDAINQAATEVCGNLVDEDCSGAANDLDCDGDDSIDQGGTDCDDNDASRAGILDEVCGNLVDEDCSGAANDLDCDGADSVDQGGTDCDDNNASIGRHVAEVCNGVDDDCDGALDGPDEDDDGDGHADSCAGEASTDCDDRDPNVYFDAPELCDGFDNDCAVNGFRRLTGGAVFEPGEDDDGDGHIALGALCDTTPVEGVDMLPVDDCDDSSDQVYPGAFEACDGVDNDCDGIPDNRSGTAVPGSACLPIDVAAGRDHTCVRNLDGTVTCWGNNNRGQLGDLHVPDDVAMVVPISLDVVQVAPGTEYTCAVTSDSRVFCWGDSSMTNIQHEYEFRAGAFSIVPGLDDVSSIAAGHWHACAILGTGDVTCWGYDCQDNLGGIPASTTCGESRRGVEVSSIDNAVQIDVGHLISCAVRETGAVHCWGPNYGGFNGTGTTESPNAGDVVGIDDAVEVACGSNFACALHTDGTVSCWGTWTADSLPAPVPGFVDIVELEAGAGDFFCGRTSTGEVLCAGEGGAGQLGDGLLTSSTSAVTVSGIDDAEAITVGHSHACALRADRLVCWGDGGSYRLGDGRRAYDSFGFFMNSIPRPVSVVAHPMEIDGYEDNTCYRMSDLSVRCTGRDTWGEGGNYSAAQADYAFPFADLSDVIDITHGYEFTCALRQTGQILCSGYNRAGQLGNDTVSAFDDIVRIGAGECHVCALHEDGTISCWGGASEGRLGAGPGDYLEGVHHLLGCTSSATPEPQRVIDIDDALQVVGGSRHTCALREGGVVSCWGDNSFGQVTSHPLGPAMWPRDVEGLPADDPVVELAARAERTCALTESGSLYCWGASFGRGAPSAVNSDPYMVFGISAGVELGMTRTSVCVRLSSGSVRCLGGNEHGELGDGTTADATLLTVPVRDLYDAAGLGCGTEHCCAVRTSGQAVCWGLADAGRLGNPWAAAFESSPVAVVDLLLFE